LAFGILFARYAVDPISLKNGWKNRPDLKPYPAMVKKEGVAKEQEDYLMKQVYPWRFKKNWK
jgi:hypothetical protein